MSRAARREQPDDTHYTTAYPAEGAATRPETSCQTSAVKLPFAKQTFRMLDFAKPAIQYCGGVRPESDPRDSRPSSYTDYGQTPFWNPQHREDWDRKGDPRHASGQTL